MNDPSPRLIDYLPALYQPADPNAEPPFLSRVLAAFEAVLLGRPDDTAFPAIGLENTLDRLDQLFDPMTTPADFLPWLASWAALSLRADVEINQQRKFIANVISLYRRRGTKDNLQQLLAIFTQSIPEIRETEIGEFQIGVSSKVGIDTIIGGGVPHFFEVSINLPRISDATLRDRQIEIARALIDLEKPAHTHYALIPQFPTMQIGVHSTVGVDTVLGTEADN